MMEHDILFFSSGKFVVKIAGIYSMTVHVFSPHRHNTAKLAIHVNRADSSGEEKLCDAHSIIGKSFFSLLFFLLLIFSKIGLKNCGTPSIA